MAVAPYFFRMNRRTAEHCLLSMEKAIKFDEAERLPMPTKQVLAIVMDSDGAKEVVQALSESGFSSEEIGLLTGTEDAQKLDAVAGKEGFLSKLFTAGIDIGSDTISHNEYSRALLNGRTVIGVLAKNDEARNSARKILKAKGARFITFFGQFVTEVMEASYVGHGTTSIRVLVGRRILMEGKGYRSQASSIGISSGVPPRCRQHRAFGGLPTLAWA